jgi:hypothetical protein
MRGGKRVPPKAQVCETPAFELTVRCTCQERCNGGWMSDLETNCAAALKRMIGGLGVGLKLQNPDLC